MTRPSFARAWAASQRIHDAIDPDAHVARLIGGEVADLIADPDPDMAWTDTGAVRMSYILNQSGLALPAIEGQTAEGEDGAHYFFHVGDLIEFLDEAWGQPDLVVYPLPGGGTLAGRQGVVLFEMSRWSGFDDHATLFDGRGCYDYCCFNEPDARNRTERASFWALD